MIPIMVSFILSFILTNFIMGAMMDLLSSGGTIAQNYGGRDTINSGGHILLLPSMIGVLPLYPLLEKQDILAYILTIVGTAYAGYIDDSLGKASIKGFRGHIGALLRGRLTTGAIKIYMAFFIGILLSLVYYRGDGHLVINVLQFGLCINFINLLDLRPGRAIKGFLILSFLLSIRIGLRGAWVLIPIIGGLTAYIKDEMNEKIMLGDTGSNLLGGILGLFTVKYNTGLDSIVLTLGLLSLHLLSEFYSFTKLIESAPLLRYIDNIGRAKGRATK